MPGRPPVLTAIALVVLVRMDMPAAARHVQVADFSREVVAIWKPYAEIVFADLTERVESRFDDELQLAISERPRPGASNASALGWIAFTAPGRPERLVTVSIAAARSLMARESWHGRAVDQLPRALQRQFLARAIGRGAAHEIGHYLLRSSAHTDGLMRAQLTVSDIMDDHERRFRLQPVEAELLTRRAALSGQLAARSDPPGPQRAESE